MKRLLSILAAVLAIARPASAMLPGGPAPVFNTYCVWDGSWTYVPINIDMTNTNMTSKSQNPRVINELNNNLNYRFVLNANGSIGQMQLFMSNVQFEPNFGDALVVSNVRQVDANGNVFSSPLAISGTFPNLVIPLYVPGSQSWQSMGAFLTLQTDYMVHTASSTGFQINKIAVQANCNSIVGGTPPMPMPLITDSTVHMGVLAAPGDTVYYSLWSEQFSSSGRHDAVVAMWREPDNSVDFDLYAKCNSLPTPTNWDVASRYAAQTFASSEFLYLPEKKCPNGNWFIAVNAYSGAITNLGNYYLQANYLSDKRPQLGVDNTGQYVLDSDAFNEVYASVRGFFGATEMSEAITYVDFYGAPSIGKIFPGQETMTITTDCTRSWNIWGPTHDPPPNAGSETSSIHYCKTDIHNTRAMVHELGHWEFGLSDEYADESGGNVSDPKCGHSIMSDNNHVWMRDYCIGLHNVTNWGVVQDHLVDNAMGQPTGPINVPSAWSAVNSHGDNYKPSWSPLGYDFNGNALTYTTSDGVAHAFIQMNRH